MSATLRLARANLRQHARRYVATTLAITLSLAFILVALSFGSALSHSLGRISSALYDGATVAVSLTDQGREENPHALKDPTLARKIQAVEGVRSIYPMVQEHLEFQAKDQRITFLTNALAPKGFDQPQLTKGALPTSASEVVVDQSVADSLKIGVGDTLEVKVAYSSEPYTPMTVTGVSEASVSLIPRNVVTPEGLQAIAGPQTPFMILVASGEISTTPTPRDVQEQVRERVEAALSDVDGIEAVTYDAAVEKAQSQIRGQEAGTKATIMLFPIIAVSVALIVVASTFRVVMQQRQREIALLRTLGGTAAQVRRLILLEAFGIGVLAALCAIVLGGVVSGAVLSMLGMSPSFIEALAWVSPTHMGIVLILGIVLAVGMGVRPAVGAARTKPLAALSAASDLDEATGRSLLRSLPAWLVTIASAAGVVWGMLLPSGEQRFLVLLLSSMVLLVGALAALSPFFPGLAKLSGVFAISTLPAMARENLMRNRGRTSATGMAIIIGVTLVSTMMVGAASLRDTLNGEVNARRPIDLKVFSVSEAIDQTALDKIASTPGVKGSVAAHYAQGAITAAEASDPQGNADLGQVIIEGQPDINTISHAPVELLPAGQVLLPDSFGFDNGQRVRVCMRADQACGVFTATVLEEREVGFVKVPEADMLALDPEARVGGVYVSLTGDHPATEVQSKLLGAAPGTSVEGAALEREMYTKMIDNVLLAVLALLGVSVLVSIVGMANTLSLSVHERTRENGLLRALGLTRAQMRRLLLWEALFISMTATVVGILMGVGFGWLGIHALPIDVQTLIVSIPWTQLGLVVVISLISTLVASWLPGRRAARTSPIEAMST